MSQSILIVEDDPGLAEMLSHYFRVQGFHVWSTELGGAACTIAADEMPDLIVLDIHLPDIDGFEVCRRLQESHKTRSIPVIFLTELNDKPDIMQGLALGVYDYITKPFDVQELRLRIRNTLHRASMRSERNPVTQLPEGEPVEDAIQHTRGGCGLLVVSLRGLITFRELYGFVASDDVLRVTSLIIRNAAAEIGGESTFCGHVDEHTFVVVTPKQRLMALEARIRERAEQSLEYFYPSSNRGENAHTPDRLRLAIGRMNSLKEPIEDVLSLKSILPRG